MIYPASQFSNNATYVSHLSQSSIRMQLIQIQLNDYDNNQDHFWYTFLVSLASWSTEFADREKTAGFPADSEAMDDFLNRFECVLAEKPLMLLLENAHCLTNYEIFHFLQSLSEGLGLEILLAYHNHAPAMTLFSALHISEVGHHAHIHGSPYMNEEQEMSYYQAAQLTLDESQFAQAREFTEGWVSAANVIRNLLQKKGTALFTHFEQEIYQWFEHEFLPLYHQPDRKLLIETSLLDDFPLELIQHLINWNGESFASVLHASPIIRYQPEQDTYRYARFLINRLKEKQILLTKREKGKFYVLVGDWYRDHDRKIEAVICYCKGEAYRKVVQLFSHWEFPVSTEYAAVCIDAIKQLPPQLFEKTPLLQVILGQMLSSVYRYEEVSQLMEKFCRVHESDTLLPELRPLLGEACLLWANALQCQCGDTDTILLLYSRATSLLPNGSKMLCLKTNYFCDHPALHLFSPETGSLKRCLDYAIKLEPYFTQLNDGRWRGSGALATAEFHFLTRNFKEVESYARQAIEIAVMQEQYDLVCSACFLLMRFFLAKGNYKNTMAAYHRLKEFAAEAHSSIHFSMPDIASSWLALKLGKSHSAADWLRDERLYSKTVKPWNYGRDRVIRAGYLLAEQQYDTLLAYTNSNINLLKKTGLHLLNIQLYMLKALACMELTQLEQAALTFEDVYNWSHKNRIVMPIVEFSNRVPPLIKLYRQSGRQNISESWLNEIEKKAVSYYVYQHNIRRQHSQEQKEKTSRLEVLTTAERKLLLMLSRGMTMKEIAELQGRSMNSVKGMSRQIYGKIGARAKADAVRIATENNIESLISL